MLIAEPEPSVGVVTLHSRTNQVLSDFVVLQCLHRAQTVALQSQMQFTKLAVAHGGSGGSGTGRHRVGRRSSGGSIGSLTDLKSQCIAWLFTLDLHASYCAFVHMSIQIRLRAVPGSRPVAGTVCIRLCLLFV